MAKRFLVGVGNVFAYSKATNELLFSSKTMIDTAIEVSTGSTEISGGQGDVLQYIYFHSPRLNLTLTETQFNLGMIASNVGSSIVTGANVWTEENVAITSNAGTVNGTPLVTPDATGTIYGWVTDNDGNTQRVTFSGQSFTTIGLADQTVCVRFYANDSSARQVVIPANFVPANVRLVIEAQLASSDTGSISGSSIIGKTEFSIDSAQLSGAQTISMTSAGVANTPLQATALASSNGVAGCSGSGVYGSITEILTNANWYDNVNIITMIPDPVAISAGSPTQQMTVWAIPTVGSAFVVPDYSDLTFGTDDAGVCTIDANGLVTRVGAGSTLVSVEITAKPSVDSTASVVSA